RPSALAETHTFAQGPPRSDKEQHHRERYRMTPHLDTRSRDLAARPREASHGAREVRIGRAVVAAAALARERGERVLVDTHVVELGAARIDQEFAPIGADQTAAARRTSTEGVAACRQVLESPRI